MPEKSEPESNREKFTDILKKAEAFEPHLAARSGLQLVGRIRKLREPDRFILLTPSPAGGAQAIELASSDVLRHETAFEDSSGEKSYRVTLSPDALVRVILAGGVTSPQPDKTIDPKYDPKFFDPKRWDPKYDPKQFDPKQTDPKQLDPKQWDPKYDPKQFDPKGDPGPIGPFVLMTRY